MKLTELKEKLSKYQYFENTDVIDVTLASVISTRLNLGHPIWMVIVGASSGGKSQIINPVAETDPKYIHRVDDLTDSTFLSGANTGEGNDPSLLHKIGKSGIIAMSDLTVLFSRNAESRNAILSQFRMIYDGGMTKHTGSGTTLTWKGRLGILAGSTPSIYHSFEEVSDMGERFIFYRMKEEDDKKATRLALGRTLYGSKLDKKLSDIYAEYIESVVETMTEEDHDYYISEKINERIIQVSSLAEKIRTTAKMDYRGELMTNIPCVAKPIRVSLQLQTLVRGLMAIKYHECGELKLDDDDLRIIDWCAYSLGNEEKRRCLEVLSQQPFDISVTTAMVADPVGLSTHIIGQVLQNLAAVGLVERSGSGDEEGTGLRWKIKDEEDWTVLRRIYGEI